MRSLVSMIYASASMKKAARQFSNPHTRKVLSLIFVRLNHISEQSTDMPPLHPSNPNRPELKKIDWYEIFRALKENRSIRDLPGVKDMCLSS